MTLAQSRAEFNTVVWAWTITAVMIAIYYLRFHTVEQFRRFNE